MNGMRVMIRLTPHHPSMPQWVISLYRSFGEPLLAKRYLRTAFGRRFAALRGQFGAVIQIEGLENLGSGTL